MAELRNPLVTVKYAATSNVIIVDAGNAVDGRGYLARDRVLLTAQTTAAENGVYEVASLAPTVLTLLTSLDALPSYRIRVRAGVMQANTQWLKQTATSFVSTADRGDAYLEVDIDDYYLDVDGGNDLPAFVRAQDSLDDGGTITFNRRIDYEFSGKLVVKKKISLRGHSTLNLASATRLMFNGSHGIHAVHGNGGDPNYPEAKGGWSRYEGLWLSYTGSFTEDVDYHGFFLETNAIVTECTVSNFPGHGVHAVGDVKRDPPSNANLLRLTSMRIYQTGLSGVYTAGADSNAGVGVAIDTTGCGQRRHGCVRARYRLLLEDTWGSLRGTSRLTITPGQHVFEDTRYGLYYIAVTGGTLEPMGKLKVEVEAYDGRLWPAWDPVTVTGSQYGYGTEYNQPSTNTITTQVYPSSLPAGVEITHGLPTTIATLGDAHGIWDDSFLGNTWVGCHSTAPGCRHYLSVKSGGSVFQGCYTENGNFGEVAPPNMRIGGLWGDPPGMQSSGLQRDTSALRLSESIWHTQGPGGVVVRRGRHKTDQIDHFESDADKHGYTLQQSAAGPLANTYSWQHQTSGAYAPLALTQPDHRRNRGHVVTRRGVILGESQIRVSAGPALPSQSEAEDVWTVGDTFFVTPPPASGQPWLYACTERVLVGDSTYDLTWAPMVHRP